MLAYIFILVGFGFLVLGFLALRQRSDLDLDAARAHVNLDRASRNLLVNAVALLLLGLSLFILAAFVAS